MKKVFIVGNFSGRNAGDAAILECLMEDVYSVQRDVIFSIPTINRAFVEKTYKRFPIEVIPLMPWNLSVKIFGVPIFRSALRADLILLTDAILFDRKLFNPLYNYLSTMALVLPMAKKRGIPVVLYDVNLGPIGTKWGRVCIQRVLDSSSAVIVRDQESVDMLSKIGLHTEGIVSGADCALNINLPSSEKINEIIKKEGILEEKGRYMSFNISSYLDVYVKGGKERISTGKFIEIISETMMKIIKELGKKIILVITQPMDLNIAYRVLEKANKPTEITLISNKKYSHNELAGILSRVEIHVGMRTHSLIFATSSCTPTVGIIATPKNRGYMQSIQQSKRMIEFGAGFTAENLFSLIKDTWEKRDMIRDELKSIIQREKKKARSGVNYLMKYLT